MTIFPTDPRIVSEGSCLSYFAIFVAWHPWSLRAVTCKWREGVMDRGKGRFPYVPCFIFHGGEVFLHELNVEGNYCLQGSFSHASTEVAGLYVARFSHHVLSSGLLLPHIMHRPIGSDWLPKGFSFDSTVCNTKRPMRRSSDARSSSETKTDTCLGTADRQIVVGSFTTRPTIGTNGILVGCPLQ